jgi:hypothetical protein
MMIAATIITTIWVGLNWGIVIFAVVFAVVFVVFLAKAPEKAARDQ